MEKLLGERKSPPIIKIQYPLTKQQQPIHQISRKLGFWKKMITNLPKLQLSKAAHPPHPPFPENPSNPLHKAAASLKFGGLKERITKLPKLLHCQKKKRSHGEKETHRDREWEGDRDWQRFLKNRVERKIRILQDKFAFEIVLGRFCSEGFGNVVVSFQARGAWREL